MGRTSVSITADTSAPSAQPRSTLTLQDNQFRKFGRLHRKIFNLPVFTLARRLAVVAAAVQYVYISLSACWYATAVLRGVANPQETLRVFTSSLIAGYLGDGLIRDSPLVTKTLQGDTTPRNFSLFLESKTKTSTQNCSSVPVFSSDIYNFDFLRRSYLDMVNDSQHNVTELSDLELVVVVVDCSFSQLVRGDRSSVRVFNVMRSREDPTDISLVMVSLSVQNYEVPDQNKLGPGLFAMLTIVQDMSGDNLQQYYLLAERYPYQRSMEFEVFEPLGITDKSFLQLKSIPEDPSTQPFKVLVTARERGFYDGAEQANIRSMHTFVDSANATRTLTKWEWAGQAITFDSYAWVHGIHFIFALQTIYSLLVLFLVMYQKLRSGKLWIGDPFSTLSTATLVFRGVLVVFSLYVNSFWTMNEYCLSFAATITGAQSIRIHREIMRADVMVFYLALVGLVSALFQERIDPSVAIFLFEFIHQYRIHLVKASSAVVTEITTYSNALNSRGVATVTPVLATMSPLKFWTAYQIPAKDAKFLIMSFFPTLILISIIAGFAILRKIYRRLHPDEAMRRRLSQYQTSSVGESTTTLKGVLTHFEISTGAELQTRFGLISDYNNYVYFKGMKFASADGVYCSGYVIANGKFLVSSKDLLAVVVMKIVGFRFKNVYVYEVDGNSVKETARLVSPKTFMWSDLWRLNVTVLL